MSRRLPNFLRASEVAALLPAARAAVDAAKTPGKRATAERDLMMVQTGLLLGCRVSEMCGLMVGDVDLEGGFLRILAGKGDKDRTLPIPARFVQDLRQHIGTRKAGFLFPGPRGRWLSPRTFQTRLAALGRSAGLAKKLKPHTLRHTFATRLLESGAAIHEVADLMGHSSIAVTSRYLHTVPERLRGAVDRL